MFGRINLISVVKKNYYWLSSLKVIFALSINIASYFFDAHTAFYYAYCYQ